MADSTDNQTREPQIQPYSRSFFDKDLQESRKSLRSLLILPMLYTTLLFWACLSLYWGSTVSSSLNKLSVSVTSLDDGSFGQNLLESIQTNSEQLVNTVNWHLDQNLLSDSGTRERVINEHIWASIQANPNTSSNLQRAVNSAHPYSYNALSAVTIYFNSARNQITTNSKVVPAILAVLNPSLAELNARFVSSFLAANSYNATNISSALKCPACLSSPFAATQVDLRPFDLPQATGSTMVGMIFLLTFTFTIFQIQRATALSTLGVQLSIPYALAFRSITSLLSYAWLSLQYALINLAFGVLSNGDRNGGQDRFDGPSAKFMVFWCLSGCTMGALGLPMESLFTFLGLKWAGYFLSFWIVVNVSSSFQSFELMPAFYQYGYAFPFFNAIQATRTILFNTKSHLGRNFGVLLAWMALGLIGIWVGTTWMIRRNKRAGGAHVVR